MAEFVEVAKRSELKNGIGKKVVLNGRQVAVFLVDHEVYVIKNLCPHQGASLAEGQVENGEVICPYHGWRFDLAQDGTCKNIPSARVRKYNVKIEGDVIFADVPGALSS